MEFQFQRALDELERAAEICVSGSNPKIESNTEQTKRIDLKRVVDSRF